jgi:prolyl-tRNA editing enzyme YbaK/EbsC (Cys-tRNA(Pro) deacylase)
MKPGTLYNKYGEITGSNDAAQFWSKHNQIVKNNFEELRGQHMQASIELLHPKVAEAIGKYGIEGEVFECDPTLADTAAFCQHYNFQLEQSANAIVVATKNDPVKYACCVVLATHKLDVNKTISKLLGVKKCSFATGEQTIESTGMQIGGVTPVGIENMPIYVDSAVEKSEMAILGGGNRSTKLIVKPAELLKLPNVQIIEGLGIPR